MQVKQRLHNVAKDLNYSYLRQAALVLLGW